MDKKHVDAEIANGEMILAVPYTVDPSNFRVANGEIVPYSKPPIDRTNGTRLLNSDYADDIESLISTRSKMWKTEWLGLEDYHNHVRSGIIFQDTEIMGLFDNGILDAIVMMKFFDAYDDIEKSCASVMNITRKRDDRLKNSSGWDINNTALWTAEIEYMESKGVYAIWTTISTNFNVLNSNPDYTIIQRYDREVIETIPAGKRAVGKYAPFINRNLAGRIFAEDVNVVLCRLKPELR